tara:strand:+ start:408 stop:566 length:159 start_codon:yes stop_codon:yes gene_type:complete
MKRTTKSRGLGDSIEKFTQATGIKQMVDTVTKGGCGCKERKDSLNRMFPYKK